MVLAESPVASECQPIPKYDDSRERESGVCNLCTVPRVSNGVYGLASVSRVESDTLRSHCAVLTIYVAYLTR